MPATDSKFTNTIAICTLLVSLGGNVVQYRKNLSDTEAAAQTLNETKQSNYTAERQANATIAKLQAEMEEAKNHIEAKSIANREADELQARIDDYNFKIRLAGMQRDGKVSSLNYANKDGLKDRARNLQIDIETLDQQVENLKMLREEATQKQKLLLNR